MKKLAKILALVLAVAMIVCSLPMAVSAEETAKISVTQENATKGSEVSIKVNLDSNPGIICMKLKLTYDSALTFTGLEDGGLLGDECHTSTDELCAEGKYDYTSDPFYLFWFNPLASENITATGTIATLTFKLSDTAELATSYPVTLEVVNTSDVLGAGSPLPTEVDADITAGSVYCICSEHTKGDTVEEVEPTCLDKGHTTYKCSVCGVNFDADETEALGHSFTNYVYNNDATCLKAGTETAKCDRCEVTDTKTSEAYPALGHSFTNYVYNNDATCLKAGTETAKCDRCDVTDTKTSEAHPALGHSFTNYVYNNDATCTENGTETAKCDRCDETNTREKVNSALGHDYVPVVTPPTCLKGGYTTYTCSRCDNTYVADETEATGHKFTNYVSNGDATCTEDGTETAKCDFCDETHTRIAVGSALGHDIVTVEAKEPDCINDGNIKYYHCNRCDKNFSDDKGTTEITDLVGDKKANGSHNYIETVLLAPTCTEAGLAKYVCSVCGDSYEAPITKLGHDYQAVVTTAPSATTAAVVTYTCSRCGDSYTKTFNTFKYGDINLDGKVNAVDVMVLQRYLAGWYPNDKFGTVVFYKPAADVQQKGINKDKVNAADTMVLQRYNAKIAGYTTLPITD